MDPFDIATAVIIQARLSSTRLPGKVLMPLADKPVLLHVVDRCMAASGVDAVCVAIPRSAESDALDQALASRPEVIVVRGSEQDVLDRFRTALVSVRAKRIVRITSDCPCIDPKLISGLLALHDQTGYVYVRNAFESGLPHGQDIEVIETAALLQAARESTDPYEREHVTPYLWRRPERFPSLLVSHRPDLRGLRLTLDTAEDYEFLKRLFDRLYEHTPHFGVAEAIAQIREDPALNKFNFSTTQTAYEGAPDQ